MAYNKVVYDGKTLIDLTEDNVTPETLAEGMTATAANGEKIVGLMPTITKEYLQNVVNTAQNASDKVDDLEERMDSGEFKGEDGKGLTILGYYTSVLQLETSVENPEVGDIYGVGSVPPYNLYAWDGSRWVDNGQLQGPKGETGDSGVYIGENPPEGTKVWINPEGEPSGNYIPTPETAEIGQTVVVKSVDENGKPFEWEAADFPEGGGEVYWEDIKDKPFGDSTTEWVQVAYGTKSGAATNITNFSASLQSGFLPKAGVTYKVVVKDMMTAISREFTGVGNILNGVVYYIGTTADRNYTISALATYTTLNVYLKEPISTMMALTVTVYERVGTIKPVPADWLPEIPVEKLPQIPAEKLPENLNGEITWEEIIDKPTNFVKDYQLAAKGYQTAEQVNALINEALGVIENGTY